MTVETRKVLYKEPSGEIKEITVAFAKKLLGWLPEGEGASKFGVNYLVRDTKGVKVRCTNNVNNRPLYGSVVATLEQEILRKRWRFNGEPIIVGKTGTLLNGQHQLVALVLAGEEWDADKDKWAEYWATEPTIFKSITYGVEEDDETVNTMDTCKPRTLVDVLYRSEYLAGAPARKRRIIARMADHAIRLLWERTGAVLDAFAPRRTHAEATAFLGAHAKLLHCLNFVYEEDDDKGQIQKYTTLGYTSALMYLFATSATDPVSYQEAAVPGDAQCDFSMMGMAENFIVWLADGSEDGTKQLVKAFAKLHEEGGNRTEEASLLVKAWGCYSTDEGVTAASLKLNYTVNDDGFRKLADLPIVGGIDIGDPKAPADSIEARVDKPSLRNGTEKRAAEVTAKRNGDKPTTPKVKAPAPPAEPKSAMGKALAAATTPKKTTPPKPKKKEAALVGKLMWVKPVRPNEEPWRGKVKDVQGGTAYLIISQGFRGAGNTAAAPVTALSPTQPTVAV
ncbi:MAG: hypothetical protein WC455_11215 [Dehalococcoidia bacterium]|jgi:hypothetical protein